jgi:hypothetical protein
MSWEEQQARDYLASLGFEPEFVQEPDPRVAQLAAQVDELQNAMLVQDAQGMLSDIEAEFDRLGVPDQVRDAVVRQAVTLPATESGYPDIHTALYGLVETFMPEAEAEPADTGPNWDELRTDDEGRRQAMAAEIEARSTDRAVGEALHPDTPEAEPSPPNLDDDDQRQAWMAERLDAMNQEAA